MFSVQKWENQMKETLIEVKGLKKSFKRVKGFSKTVIAEVRAVENLNFSIYAGETLALVGESGCGKTTTGRCLIRAIDPDAGQVVYRFRDEDEPVDFLALDKKSLRRWRKKTGLIFQDPYSSLNPRLNVFDVIAEPLKIIDSHAKHAALEERVAFVMEKVGLYPGDMKRYPHAFSGGQRQRIAIARELSFSPEFIVADESVSALDVSVQAQILNLLNDLKKEMGITYLFISHDLSVVEYLAQRIAVMYVGSIVELADCESLLTTPKHPYTEALLKSVPRVDPEARSLLDNFELSGEVADPGNPPSGCIFHPRCKYMKAVCREQIPEYRNLGTEETPQYCACHFADTLTIKGIN